MRLVCSVLKESLVLLVISGLLLAGCASAGSVDKTTTPTPASQPARSAQASWETIALSRLTGTDRALLFYAVSPVDPGTIYACIGNGSSPSQHPIRLWRTHDAGQHWSALSLPASAGTGCAISIAASQPQRIAFLATNTYANQHPCDQDTLYLSNDGGNSWKHIPYTSLAPAGAQTVFCQVTVTTHSLYLCYSYVSGQNTSQVSILERTEDDGATWQRIDSAFGASALFSPPEIGPNDTLAIAVTHLSSSNSQLALWMSHDGGDSWQQAGILPTAGTYLLAPRQQIASWPSSTAPFYMLASEQIPSDLYELRAFESGNGRQWTALPPLPAPGTSVSQPGLLQALAVTDDGRFLAFGVNPETGLPSHPTAGQESTPAF